MMVNGEQKEIRFEMMKNKICLQNKMQIHRGQLLRKILEIHLFLIEKLALEN